MPRFFAEPPQGHEDSQQLRTEGGFSIVYIRPAQGLQSEEVPAFGPSMQYEDNVIMEYEIEWLNLSWAKRIPLSINSSQVPTTQSNFPVLINSIFTDLIGETEAELRFTGINNVQLEYEIQKFDNVTGELIAWVKMPSISDGDIIHIYYDNPTAIDEQNPNAVWDVNYKSVYHLQNNANDSTSNAQNMTNFGTALTPVIAKIGDGQNYGGTVNDYSIRNPFTGFPLNEITAEFWIKTASSGDGMISYADTGTDNSFLLFDQGDFTVLILNSAELTSLVFNDNVFHHIVVTWRSSDGQLIVYIDGVSVHSVTHQMGVSLIANGGLVLGQDQDSIGGGFEPAMSLNGILDEVRVSDIVRSSDWIITEFNNQDNSDLFYSISPSETPGIAIKMVYEG